MNGTLLEENICLVDKDNSVPRMGDVENLSQFHVQSCSVFTQVSSTDDIKRLPDVYSLSAHTSSKIQEDSRSLVASALIVFPVPGGPKALK